MRTFVNGGKMTDKKINEIGKIVLELQEDIEYLKQTQEKLKFRSDCIRLLGSSIKELEKELNIKIRNGNQSTAIKQTLIWVLKQK